MSNPEIKLLVDSFVSRLEQLVRESALAAVTEAFGVGQKAAPVAAAKKSASKPAAKKSSAKPAANKKPAAPAAKAPAAAAPAKSAGGTLPAPNTIAALAISKPSAGAKPAAAKPATAKAAKPAGKRNRRSPADLDRDVGRLVAHVRSNPGATTEKLRAALGLEREIWKSTVARAVETKQIERKGERRDATLHLPKAK